MNTFKLTQGQVGKNLYLLPNGAGCAVPTTTITVRPDGDSAVQCSAFPGAGEDNYEDVDEVIADDDTTYTYWNTPLQQKIDRYSFTIPAEAKTMGLPTSIKVYARVRRVGRIDAGNVSLGRGVGTPGGNNCSWTTHDDGDLVWHDYTETYNTNPDTGDAWTWAELEAATLTFGVVTNNGDEGRCTQIYAEITYDHSYDYLKVDDPIHNPDDDTTYVHNDTDVLIPDLFTAEDHTTENGTINYLQIFARAKSNLIAPHPDATYKILLDDSACTDTQKSNNIDLVTTYSKYSYTWNTNPYRGDVAFDWDDVDDYQFGIESQSPIVYGESLFATFRPNAAGVITDWTPHGAVNNWDCVNEATSDGDSTYIKNETASPFNACDLYNIPDHTTESGVITGVTVFYRVRSYGDDPGDCRYCSAAIQTGGVKFFGDYTKHCGTTYSLYSYTWTENPDTVVPWTWADIDALEIGIHSNSLDSYCTQIYMVVEYSPATSNPDIRTTQCYMKVNYDETVTCDLNMPEEISQDYVQNIKMLNHWSGNRSVYGLSKDKDTTVMVGYEINNSLYDDTWCDAAYERRRKITIDHTQVDGNLTNFPVYVDITLDEECFNDDGYDIMFCSSTCTNYDFEIEYYSKLSKQLKVWVKIPTVSSTVDTDLWIYYQKNDVTVNPSVTAVWDDAGYGMVQHMTDNPDNATITGSTDAGHVGTKGAADGPKEQNSNLYKSQCGDGIDDVIEIPANNADLNLEQGNFTLSLWVKTSSDQNERPQDIIAKNKDVGTGWVIIRHGRIGWFDGVWAQFYQDALNYIDFQSITPQLSDGVWHLVHIVIDKGEVGTARGKIYWDGAFHHNAHHFVGNPNLTSVDNIRMYKGTFSGAGWYWDGVLNEVRWAKGKVCSAAWIAAEYANQKEDSTFLILGVEETRIENTDACTKLKCVEELGKQGDPVTLTGFSYSDYNDEYRILSWGWKKISDKPVHYEWILELERTT